MKLIISGSRSITDYSILLEAISLSPYQSRVTEIVSGNARGADLLGEQYARDHDIPLHLFPAKWNKYGPSAGFKRNAEMAAYADALLSLWDGLSHGTCNMISTMKCEYKPYFVYCPNQKKKPFYGNLSFVELYPVK